MKHMTSGALRLGILAATVAGTGGAASAQTTYEWTGSGDGQSFGDPLNWTPGGVPGPLDEAKFDAAGSQTVSFGQSRTTDFASIENDSVVFAIGPYTYTVNGLVVGERAGDVGVLDLASGQLSVGASKAIVGRYASSVGSLTVAGGASLACSGDFIIGDAGGGALVIEPGAVVTCPIAFVADEAGSDGAVTVRGIWTINGIALFGNGGHGTVDIIDGATVSATDGLKIGDNDELAEGYVVVDGAGSTLSAGFLSVVGNLGSGEMLVSSGGTVTTTDLTIGKEAAGAVTIDGPASSLTDSYRIRLGDYDTSSGTLYLANGGVAAAPTLDITDFGALTGEGQVLADVINDGVVRPGAPIGVLSVDGSYTGPSGDLEFEIGGPDAGSGYDLLTISGDAVLGGGLTVSLANGYNPATGQFVILEAASVTGTFNVLHVPVGFHVSYEPTRVVLVRSDCLPDYNGDGVVNSQDFILFLNAFVAGDSSADFNGDGVVNSQDFIAFLNAFVSGC